jgi:hypothetical protein
MPANMKFTLLTTPSIYVSEERSKKLHLEALEKEWLFHHNRRFYEIKNNGWKPKNYQPAKSRAAICKRSKV